MKSRRPRLVVNHLASESTITVKVFKISDERHLKGEGQWKSSGTRLCHSDASSQSKQTNKQVVRPVSRFHLLLLLLGTSPETLTHRGAQVCLPAPGAGGLLLTPAKGKTMEPTDLTSPAKSRNRKLPRNHVTLSPVSFSCEDY